MWVHIGVSREAMQGQQGGAHWLCSLGIGVLLHGVFIGVSCATALGVHWGALLHRMGCTLGVGWVHTGFGCTLGVGWVHTGGGCTLGVGLVHTGGG